MNSIKPFINYFIFSNIFVALPVSLLVLQTNELVGEGDNNFAYFVYFSTLLVYCTHRLYPILLRKKDNSELERHIWVKEHKLFSLAVWGGAAIATVVLVFRLNQEQVILLIPCGLISVCYALPIYKKAGRLVSLRDIPMAKIFLITIVVSFVTVYLPLANQSFNLLDRNVQFHFLTRCLFIFAITIPFDIRDMQYDKEDELMTIPRKFGIEGAKKVAYLFLILMGMTASWHYYLNIGLSFNALIAIIASMLISIAVIAKLNKQSTEYYYSLIVEGMMIVQYGLVYFLKLPNLSI